MLGLLEGTAYLWERSQANGPYAWELVASRRVVWNSFSGTGAGYTLLDPDRSYKFQGIPVVINSHGLRGPETTYEKPPGTYRILNLGDSVAMGWGVRLEESYGRQLELMLNGQLNDDRQFEVINAGVPGWNLENARAYLEAEGLRYEPDLVLLDLTIVNDIYGKNALVKQQRPAVIEWLRANTYFWPFLSVQVRWMEARAAGRARIDVIDPPSEASGYFPLDPAAKLWTEIYREIRAMDRIAEQHGAELVLIMFPLEHQVLDGEFSTLPQKILTEMAAADGISVLDLLPAYQQACRAKPDGPCSHEDRYLFADVWMHPSATGHRLAAVQLMTFLDAFIEKSAR